MRLWDAISDAIRTPRRRRIGPDEAERLLAGGHDPAHPELSQLLAAAAASAPPRPDERAGLDAAVAAFEEAGRVERPAPAPRRRRALRPLAAAAAVAAVLVGGVAVAAETGYLPGDDRPPARERLAPRDSPSSAARTSPGSAGGPAGTPGSTATGPPGPTASGQTVAPPDPALEKLCRTWDDRRQKGKPMKPDDLRELARAAGGEERIAAFCAPLLRPPGGRPSPSEKEPGKKGN